MVTGVFLMIHLVPGDPVVLMLGENAQPADYEALREQLGLNKGLGEQYIEFWGHLLKMDLGKSIYHRQPVMELIGQRLPATAALAVGALFVSLLLSLPLGIISALKPGKWPDYLALGVSILGISVPIFWLGPLLIIIFAVKLHWLPVAGLNSWKHLILPSIALGFGLAAITTRIIRASMIEVLNQNYIKTAKAKGLSQWEVLRSHALKNAMIPVVTVIGLQLGALLGGAIITEMVFSYPGVGRLLILSILRRDYPMVQGAILVISTIYLVVNLLTDIIYGYLDPRIRLQ
ncbi:MAG: ABC transporter permease [Calditrichia bacterium]